MYKLQCRAQGQSNNVWSAAVDAALVVIGLKAELEIMHMSLHGMLCPHVSVIALYLVQTEITADSWLDKAVY